jgi:hypothetical protein
VDHAIEQTPALNSLSGSTGSGIAAMISKMSRTTFWTALICVSIVAGVAFSLLFYG